MWIKQEFPIISGYETLGNSVEAKRWLDFRLDELLDSREPVRACADVLTTRGNICRFVIEEIDYPMVKGVPVDAHRDNWFSGLCCHTLQLDFWQQASETIRTLRVGQINGKKGYGDCEDVSVLFTDLFLIKGWKAFEILGEVYQDSKLLGGHGWAIFEDEGKIWRLYEATLTKAPSYPSGYPVIDPNQIGWKVGDITYSGQAKFDRDNYYEINGGALAGYLALQVKETRKKYEAIQHAWHIPSKPIAKAGLLGQLRWR